MEIQSLSVNMYQSRVREEAVVQVQQTPVQTIRDIREDLDRLLESVQVITDPNLGNYLNMFM